MGHEELIEKLLNEGLELLSSEKEQKQRKGFVSLRAAFGLGSMELLIMKEFVVKTELGYTKAMNKLSGVLKWLRMQFLTLCMNLVYAILME